jgi:hypothetical protein
MKKIITLSLLLASFAFTATFASAQTYNPQRDDRYDQNRRDQRDQRNWRNTRGTRVTTQTRIVRQGFRTYRETVQIKYFPNGKVTTKVLSRTRIR